MLGSCVRCLTPTPATSNEIIGFGQSAYRLALCERHADMLMTDMLGWTRLGVILDDIPVHKKAVGGNVQASYVHIPRVVAVPDVVEEECPNPDNARVNRWLLTAHALERSEQRGISHAEARLAAERPTSVRVGNTPGTQVRIREHVQVVVKPEAHSILTVINLREDT